MKKFIKEIYPYIIIVIIVVLFRTFIATPVRVDGESMENTLHNNEILILNKLDKTYDRFDIVVINYNNSKLVKRIIGLPGETIKYIDEELYINDKKIIDSYSSTRTNDFSEVEIKEGYCFVMGDNRLNSNDSRYDVGLVKKEDIVGTTSIRLFPFNKIGKIK